MFDGVLLEPEHVELLCALVEAARNVPRSQREKFIVIQTHGGDFIRHPGLAGWDGTLYLGDVEALGREGLLAITYGPQGSTLFDVTPRGFAYYDHVKRGMGKPVERVEASIRTHLAADHFQRVYGNAYQKWVSAEQMLWSSDSERQLTNIGHLCREALQEFAAALLHQYKPADVDQDKSHTVARIRTVLHLRSQHLGSAEKALLDALLVYWGTVSDLAQRQEHGGQKERLPLIWEDGRRLVFQTAVVMFEADCALSRAG